VPQSARPNRVTPIGASIGLLQLADYLYVRCRWSVHSRPGHYREPFELLHFAHTHSAAFIPRLWASWSSRSAAV